MMNRRAFAFASLSALTATFAIARPSGAATAKRCTQEVPVMADKCDVELNEWRPLRTLSEKGTTLADKPRWPRVRWA